MADPFDDPRDAIIDVARGLDGLVDLLTEGNREVSRLGIEYLLRLLLERLEPAAEAIQGYQPRK